MKGGATPGLLPFVDIAYLANSLENRWLKNLGALDKEFAAVAETPPASTPGSECALKNSETAPSRSRSRPNDSSRARRTRWWCEYTTQLSKAASTKRSPVLPHTLRTGGPCRPAPPALNRQQSPSDRQEHDQSQVRTMTTYYCGCVSS